MNCTIGSTPEHTAKFHRSNGVQHVGLLGYLISGRSLLKHTGIIFIIMKMIIIFHNFHHYENEMSSTTAKMIFPMVELIPDLVLVGSAIDL